MDMEKINPSTAECFIESIEQFWGFGLPKSYKEFLFRCNGGIPVQRIFDFKNGEAGSVLSEFYGFVKGSNNLLVSAKDMGDRYMSTMLPIADDVCGNRILLTVKGSDRDKIYFWDHEMESYEDEQPNYSNLTLIADDFDEFINSLRSPDEVAPSE